MQQQILYDFYNWVMDQKAFEPINHKSWADCAVGEFYYDEKGYNPDRDGSLLQCELLIACEQITIPESLHHYPGDICLRDALANMDTKHDYLYTPVNDYGDLQTFLKQVM